MSVLPSHIRGVLFDLDGTLFLGDVPYPKAIETVAQLRAEGIKVGFLSNITRMSRPQIVSKLKAIGFEAKDSELINPAFAGLKILQRENKSRAMLMVPAETKTDFVGIVEDNENPQAIVVGDLGDDFLPKILNQAFLHLMRGAELYALQKNRYWRVPEGFKIDAGSYVALLEYAANKKAKIVGKPEPDFYKTALQMLDLQADQVAMIGDDIYNDVKGAQNVGVFGVLVRTGKFSKGEFAKSGVQPNLTLASVAELCS